MRWNEHGTSWSGLSALWSNEWVRVGNSQAGRGSSGTLCALKHTSSPQIWPLFPATEPPASHNLAGVGSSSDLPAGRPFFPLDHPVSPCNSQASKHLALAVWLPQEGLIWSGGVTYKKHQLTIILQAKSPRILLSSTNPGPGQNTGL